MLARAHEGHPPFIELKPEQPVDTAGKIEVLEFFWYGCPHCYRLEPLLETWLAKLPPDVAFRRVPAVIHQRSAQDANLFYAFQALELEKLHRPLFDAIHRDGLRTEDAKAVATWLRKNSVDALRFEQTLKSFGVQAKARRAQQLSASYRLEGVPTMAVHGRHVIEAGRGFDEMLKTTDQLIGAMRKELGAKR